MKDISVLKKNTSEATILAKQRSYAEVVEYLDAHWKTAPRTEKDLVRMQTINAFFSSTTKKFPAIIINGTNGKSLTSHFTTQLLKTEGLVVGTLLTPHFFNYNERIALNAESISNKIFTDLANEIINITQENNIEISSHELLTQMAFNFFAQNKVDVAILESEFGGQLDATAICTPKILAITRMTDKDIDGRLGHANKATIQNLIKCAHKTTHVVSADQIKENLKLLQDLVKEQQAIWEMPIRKLVDLDYPFAQLHGRSAALAERIASVFINTFANKNAIVIDSVLTKKEGQRGRPTLVAKQKAEKNPKRTLAQFWKQASSELPGRFQIFHKEKPTIVLDNVDNSDALENFLLGVRLLQYKNSYKEIVLIFGFKPNSIDIEFFIHHVRYLLKKVSGNVIICSTKESLLNAKEIIKALQEAKIKIKEISSLKEALHIATSTAGDQGLVAIAGPVSFINEYWNLKGIKKAS